MPGARPGRRPSGPHRRPPREAPASRRPRAAPATVGGEQVEGRRAVRELLAAGTRAVRTVWLSDAAEADALVDEIAGLAGARLRRAPPERVAALARSDAHQGVVALADPLPPARLDALLAAPAAFLVALDGVTDPRNLGAVLRAAETAGATGALLPKRGGALVTPAVAKAAAGAVEHVPIALVSGIPAALDRSARAGVWCVGLDGGARASLFDLELATEPVVVVLGAEGQGLARLTRERCDVLVRIPMRGAIDSLNVASAAALACHEVARRRAAPTGGGTA